jgi:hypothetical protein
VVIPTRENGPAPQALSGIYPDAVQNCGETPSAKLLVNDESVNTTVRSGKFGGIERVIEVKLGRVL